MAKESLPKWLVRRGGRIHYVRRVPSRYAQVDPRTFVTHSCDTDDVGQAVIARDRINAEVEAYWQSLVRGDGDDARARYEAAIEYARNAGFSYRDVYDIAKGSVEDLLKRLATLEQRLAETQGRRTAPAEKAIPTQALLGGVVDPGLRLSTLAQTFEDMVRDENRSKSDPQMHKWRLPRLRAIANMIEVVGDKPVGDLSRSDALAFRGWWADRIIDEDLAMETPNKDIAYLSTMLMTVSDRMELDLDRLFRGLRFKSVSESPPPFSTDFIRTKFLVDGALAGLNAEARAVVLIMIETGARPVEITHLRPQDIRLEDDIPHISIEPQKDYALKTRYSKRELPIIGVAVEGARILKTGKARYRDNTSSLSALVNKFFSVNGLRESERHTLYSFRHAFKDRLTSVSAPDIVDASLMGHKFSRPAYGRGPTLELKLEWVQKIAVSI